MLPSGETRGRDSMLRTMSAAGVAVVLTITGIFASPALANGTTTWSVQAGSLAFEPPGIPVGGGNRFYPESIAIHPGDTVAFTAFGAHTITFNRPAGPVFNLFGPSGVTTLGARTESVNSGLIGAGPPATFPVTFASTLPAGRYKFICMLHVGMTELIDVLPMSKDLPKTNAQYGAIAQREITRDLATLADIASAARENNEDQDGSPKVLAGAGNKRVSNLRFFPQTTTIHVGQTVTFLKTQDPTEPHTVLFGGEGLDQFQELFPSGGNTYNGSGTVNSGFLSTKRQYRYFQVGGVLPPPTTKFKVTFTAAGRYQYICALHDQIGMRGTIVVDNP
jgi:plastocyanin